MDTDSAPLRRDDALSQCTEYVSWTFTLKIMKKLSEQNYSLFQQFYIFQSFIFICMKAEI